MRRMLSGFLAASMVASVCATMSFAAYSDATKAQVAIDFSGVRIEGTPNGLVLDGDGNPITANAWEEDPTIVITLSNDATITITANRNEIERTATPAQVVRAFANGTIEVSSDARFDNGSAMRREDLRIFADGTNLILQTKVAGKDAAFSQVRDGGGEVQGIQLNPVVGADNNDAVREFTAGVVGLGRDNGYTGPASGSESRGDVTLEEISQDIRNIFVCDEEGNPLPLTEKPDGVDKDQNTDDGVQSGQTVYFMVRNDLDWKFHDDTYWKMKVSKGDNGKYIKAISDVTKNFGTELYNVYTHTRQPGVGTSRSRFIKVEMNEIHTDDEFKVTLDVRLTPKTKALNVFGDASGANRLDDDAELKINDFSFYVKNIVKSADGEWTVGVGGLMLNPVKNDWNEVTYTDEDGDVAFMKFFGDSDTGKFYAKLSTKWEHADYASYFNDQDAYIFQFTGSPSLSSTSRADLQIYNPFVDDDGNETFDPEQAVIYQVVDGDLFDITDSFEYREGDTGDMAYCTRTRFLGTYIICQKPVEEASNDDVVDLVPDDVVPDNNAGAPVEVNPGNNNNGGNGGKAPANTGKF